MNMISVFFICITQLFLNLIFWLIWKRLDRNEKVINELFYHLFKMIDTLRDCQGQRPNDKVR